MNDVLFTIGENPPPRLDKALARNVPERAISRSRLSRMIADGAVEVNGVVATEQKARVVEGDKIVIHVPAAVESHMLPENITLEILHEDDDLIVVNKPSGMVVHPAPGSPSGTLVNALLAHCGDRLSGVGGLKRPGIVHRIDKDTTGLLVVAKSDAAHQGLAAQFLDHSVSRLYTAICFGVPSAADPRLMGLAGTSFEAGNQLKIITQHACVFCKSSLTALQQLWNVNWKLGAPTKFVCICPIPAMLCLAIKLTAVDVSLRGSIPSKWRAFQDRHCTRAFWASSIL